MKYPCLPGLTPDGTVYQNSAMGTVEAMLPPGPWATAVSYTHLDVYKRQQKQNAQNKRRSD